jgi:aminodeoxychorismate lyase
MIVFLNGHFIPEEQATVSIFDRSFLYGDGLFETILVANAKPFRLVQHWERLERGAKFLGVRVPYPRDVLSKHAAELIDRNQTKDALLRVTLSRGVGIRGYSPKGAESPTLTMTLHPLRGATSGITPRWQLRSARFRLPADEPLAQFKTCNKLVQIMARAEAESSGANEALLVNTDGFAVEGASSNLFWIEHGTVCTPPLASGILAGITRQVVPELCAKLKLPFQESNIRPEGLAQADAVFLSLSSHGIVEVSSLDGVPLHTGIHVTLLSQAFWLLVRQECK